jgi:hypothetical protein
MKNLQSLMKREIMMIQKLEEMARYQVLSKLDINSLVYGCGHVIFCVTTCVSKRFFSILNVLF